MRLGLLFGGIALLGIAYGCLVRRMRSGGE
jgi:hypothetical protein